MPPADPTVLAALSALRADYCRCLDAKDWPGIRSLLTDDACLDLSAVNGAPPLRGADAVVAFCAERYAALNTHHAVADPVLQSLDDAGASVMWVQDSEVRPEAGSPVRFLGEVFDRYRRDGKTWKIAAIRLGAARV